MQEEQNIEQSKHFTNDYYYELVDLAIADAARAGRAIIDTREVETNTPALDRLDNLEVMGSGDDVVASRERLVRRYCADKRVSIENLTVEDVIAILSLPGWR